MADEKMSKKKTRVEHQRCCYLLCKLLFLRWTLLSRVQNLILRLNLCSSEHSLAQVSENAWSASAARWGSQLTLKQVRHRGKIKRFLCAEAPRLSRKSQPRARKKTKLINGPKVTISREGLVLQWQPPPPRKWDKEREGEIKEEKKSTETSAAH